ncbi:MAG: hypothetical protein JW862_10430 [Anaerolineales bacterium]|nr:hypothetical protein [Anaerolineales bacterium]
MQMKRIQTWRKIILVLMLVAISGPWVIERLNVPAPYACSQGFRVNENFCGIPFSGIYFLFTMLVGLFHSTLQLLAGSSDGLALVYSLWVVWVVLSSLLSLVVVIARQTKSGKGAIFVHLGLFVVAIVLGWVGAVGSEIPFQWQLWGIWLYLFLLLSEVILESLFLFSGTQPNPNRAGVKLFYK